jgi:hypothetical protein
LSAPLVAVTDRESLGQALRQLRDAQSRIAENIATHDAEVKRIGLWLSQETAMDYATIQNLTALIRPYALAEAERQVAMGGHKRVSHPDGECDVRAQQPEFERDVELLTPWAVANGYLRQPKVPDPELDWNRLKGDATVRGDRLVLGETGELIPGVTVIARPDQVTIRPAKGER